MDKTYAKSQNVRTQVCISYVRTTVRKQA